MQTKGWVLSEGDVASSAVISEWLLSGRKPGAPAMKADALTRRLKPMGFGASRQCVSYGSEE